MRAELAAALVISLAATAVLEEAFFFITGKRGVKDALLVLAANVLTNPPVVLIYWLAVVCAGWNRIVVTVPLEVAAVVVEGWIYRTRGNGFKRPFLFSAAANGFSYGIGFIIQKII